jgi:hypothetical protein
MTNAYYQHKESHMKNRTAALLAMGGFVPEPSAPTCSRGLGLVVDDLVKMTMEERVRTCKVIMDAVWSQPPPPNEGLHPVLETVPDLINALSNGWAYNANEGDNIFAWFGDIRPAKDAASGELLGAGILAPDCSLIRNGRDLVDWRDLRWAGVRVSNYLSEVCLSRV